MVRCPHQVPHGSQVNSAHDESRRERVPQTVPRKILDAGKLDGVLKPVAGIE